MTRRNATGQALVLLIMAALPYFSALDFGFVYDDHGSIVENGFLANPANVHKALTLQTFRDPHVIDGQRPAVLVSYFIDRALWGLRPFGWHVTNLLLHLAATLGVYLLARRISRIVERGAEYASLVPFGAALLFGLHPALTEAVQVPSFREDLLVTVFGLFYLVVAWQRRGWVIVAVQSSLLALALLSKETAVVLPALLVWFWILIPPVRPAPRVAIAALSIQVTMVLAYLLNAYAGRPLQAASGVWNGLSLRVPENLATLPILFLDYVGLLLVPHPLCVERLVRAVPSVSDPQFLIGVCGLILFVWTAGVLLRRAPLVMLGMGWIFLVWLPVSNLIPLFNPLAERYLYFAAPGFALLLAAALAELPRRTSVWALVIALATSYGAMAANRLQDWRDDETLWMATITTEARSARAHTWLALIEKGRGNRSRAERYLRHAHVLNPQDVAPLANLGVMAGEDGDFEAAEKYLLEAVKLRPDRADLRWNLGLALAYQGREGEAMKQIGKAAELDPTHPQASAIIRAMRGAEGRGSRVEGR